MNIKRIWALIKHEVLHGPKDAVLVMSIVMPVLLALFVNLAFGNIFSDRGKLGVYDAGASQLVSALENNGSISIRVYDSEAALRQATLRGSVDMGIALPADFDAGLTGGVARIQAYIWGESQAQSRAIIPAVLAETVRQVAGVPLPVNIESQPLGDNSSVPWSDRLLPLVVFMAVFYGGLMLPASSLINEKQHRTRRR
jgi:ABC-2 type transport system permease protein